MKCKLSREGWRNRDGVTAGFWHYCQSGVRFGVRCCLCLFKSLRSNAVGMEPVAGLGLCPRFRYEENMGFPSDNQELFGLTRHYFSLLFYYFH